MNVRQLTSADFDDALRLYRVLTRDPVPVSNNRAAFDTVLSHPGTCILGMENSGRVASMITLHVLPNMTSGGRPYALIENVVTDPDHRGNGMARAVIQAGFDHARAANAYKVMLLTGTTRGALGFYEKMGFTAHEKHGLVYRF